MSTLRDEPDGGKDGAVDDQPESGTSRPETADQEPSREKVGDQE
ncbi:MAG TPA: hypothetical protein VGD78_03765 [Chthoniobacterales bacterium]